MYTVDYATMVFLHDWPFVYPMPTNGYIVFAGWAELNNILPVFLFSPTAFGIFAGFGSRHTAVFGGSH